MNADPFVLTGEQRAIVEAPDGPVVVIAGAGTGKTRVIVERVRWLLERYGAGAGAGGDDAGEKGAPSHLPSEPGTRDRPFDGPLVPEQILVLTYNVKAAHELQVRLDQAVGAPVRARMSVTNFDSFCHRILSESAADAGIRPNPDVIDGVGQYLLLRDIRPNLPLVYHNDWALADFVKFINRAKDELVTPVDFDRFADEERRAFEERFGSYERAVEQLGARGNLRGPRDVRKAYASVRRGERAEARGDATPTHDPREPEKTADREARRAIAGTGRALYRSQIDPRLHDQIDELAETYVRDGAALEVMRVHELAAVYHAYQAELVERGALDFGEQIAAVTQVFKVRPNLLRRWQRQFRYILVDEFQDANIAQIELIELLGRTPDRPDNVMVVGDDDQSIYRFRGASFAAFSEFDRRFARPPTHDRNGAAPGPPLRRRLERNFRSTDNVLAAANRLIERNQTRFEPDKRLRTERERGERVELITCAGPEDEAVAIVDAIRERLGPAPRWSDVAILYRKHRHREAIVARLRDEDIPYTVVGGLSLFAMPEIRDLEQGLRAIANPTDDVALTRMMTAGPWRLDALEILRLSRMASFDRRHLIDAVHEIVGTGEVAVEVAMPAGETEAETEGETEDGAAAAARPPAVLVPAAPDLRAKLRRLLGVIEELQPRTWRDGPFSILERYLELTGQVLDMIAVDTTDAQRVVANIASFLRFAADWQAAHPNGTLAGFVDYLDAYQAAGGELPTSVELTEDVEGVRLMTLYQAKGLEFRHVFVPYLLESEWPTKEGWSGYFPPELLREPVPDGDVHTEEERRLLYVAMTRAQDRLTLTTHAGPTILHGPSLFVGELREGAGAELDEIDRTAAAGIAIEVPGTAEDEDDGGDLDDGRGAEDSSALDRTTALMRRVMPLPSKRERRLELRLRATELIGMLEGTADADPETEAARGRLEADLAATGRAAVLGAEEARALGLDPLTFRVVALDSGAGANLLDVASLPAKFSYSQFSQYEACPLRYAFGHVYRIPPPEKPVAAFAFGSTAHEAFEAFTKERRERLARAEPPPTREDLERLFRDRWVPTRFGDQVTEQAYQRRVETLLDNFWTGEVSGLGQALHEELWFDLTLAAGPGAPAVVIGGSIDRIDRLPSGGIEVIDYKTGRVESQKGVDESLQLSIYALACRDALGLGTPERVTLYFTESALRLSTTRTDEQLDAVREDVLARVARIRSGDFAATPSAAACRYCDFARMCPSRVQ